MDARSIDRPGPILLITIILHVDTQFSLNVVGETATICFVACKCAGTGRKWKPGDGVLKCSDTDAVRHLRGDAVRATIQFLTSEVRMCKHGQSDSEHSHVP